MDADGRPLAADLVERVPFLVLGMDLPPAPLYKDALERNIIPQVLFCSQHSRITGGVTSTARGSIRTTAVAQVGSAHMVQVPIFEILHKYDGQKVHDDIKLGRRRYKFTRLPNFLAMHMKRFTKNNFYVRAPMFCAGQQDTFPVELMLVTAVIRKPLSTDTDIDVGLCRWKRTRQSSTSPLKTCC